MFESILFLISPFIYCADILIPKSKKKILFYGRLGHFTGNPKYLYQYICENLNYHCIWLSRHHEEADKLAQKYGDKSILYIENIKGIVYLLVHYLTAKNLIIRGKDDLWPLRRYTSSRRRTVIDLLHGVPIKNTGIMVPGRDEPQTEKKEIKKRDAITYHTVPSDLVRYFLSACYSVSLRKFPITGDPRNDTLIKLKDNPEIIRDQIVEKCDIGVDFEKIILYAPTHRDPCMLAENEERPPQFFPFPDFSREQLVAWLEEKSAILLLRTHALSTGYDNQISDISRIPPGVGSSNRVYFCPHKLMSEANELLAAVDILWTDYSGIYLDFLLTERPVLFIPYDLQEYKKYRGILFDYNLITPGPKVLHQASLLGKSSNFLDTSKEDVYAERRKWLKKLFHEHTDGQACDRITRLIEKS